MRIGVGTGFAIITGATIVSILIIASVVAVFIRETSGIEERWGTRTMAERDADITNPVGQLEIPDNTTDFTSPPISTAGDHDGDGIPNNRENNSGTFNGPEDPGTDPTNPDTDGDGVADGIEILLGTDPNDPDDGGLPVITTPRGQDRPSGMRINFDIVKRVRLTEGGSYSHYVTAPADGTQVDFRIDLAISVTNLPRGSEIVAILEDIMPRGLRHVAGSDYIIRGNNPPERLPGSLGQFRIPISGDGAHQFTFTFSATVEEAGLWENIARVRLENFPLEGDIDKAIVLGQAVNLE